MKRGGGSTIRNGRLYARVRYGKGERFEERVPWAKTRAEARDRSLVIGELCDVLVDAGLRGDVRRMAKQVAAAETAARLVTVRRAVEMLAKRAKTEPEGFGGATFKDVADAWVTGDLCAKHPDHVRPRADLHIEKGRLERYIYPYLADVPVSALHVDDADLVMANLPPHRVKSKSTRRAIAQIIMTILGYAVMPLKLIKQSPLPAGWLPKLGERKHYTCLFPKEEAQLLRCDDVPEELRLFFGVLDREGMRVSELADSEWDQWNTDVGIFSVRKSKTKDPRMWAVRPDTNRAMRIWKARHGKTKKRPFIDFVADEKAKLWIATKLREAIALAKIDRPELHASTKYTGKLRAHDLRATFVTVSLAEGKQETWIRDRTGHTTISMIDRYRRAARQFQELRLGSLVDLVEALGWMKEWVTLAATGTDDDILSIEDDDGFRRMDSNHDKRIQKALRVVGVGSSATDDEGSDDAEPPPRRRVTHDSPTLRRLPEDVQGYVAKQLGKSYPKVFAGDREGALAPLAKAARAIERGRAPRAKKRAAGGSR